jgi:energy-converting hydrogenase B subunit D
MNFILLVDVVLVAIMLITAWLALTTPDLQRAVIMFIAFGLLVALAWVRLQAPDVAMAEAAVGAGLTGALLISTLNSMREMQKRKTSEVPRASEADAPEQEGQHA